MDELFCDVKNYLDITWEMTEEEKQKLSGMIAREKLPCRGRLENATLKATRRKRRCFQPCPV